MAWYDFVLNALKRLVGPRRGPPIPPPPPPPIEIFWKNTVWGHVIYKPTQVGRWKVPAGMRTLREFIMKGAEHAMEQSRKGKGEHPLALEVFCEITLKEELTKNSRAFSEIKNALSAEIVNEGFGGGVLDWMEWGVEHQRGDSDDFKSIEAGKRYSRDGENFTEHNIKGFVIDRLNRTLTGLIRD